MAPIKNGCNSNPVTGGGARRAYALRFNDANRPARMELENDTVNFPANREINRVFPAF
jgi:hypothetical protein